MLQAARHWVLGLGVILGIAACADVLKGDFFFVFVLVRTFLIAGLTVVEVHTDVVGLHVRPRNTIYVRFTLLLWGQELQRRGFPELEAGYPS